VAKDCYQVVAACLARVSEPLAHGHVDHVHVHVHVVIIVEILVVIVLTVLVIIVVVVVIVIVHIVHNISNYRCSNDSAGHEGPHVETSPRAGL